MSTRIMQSVAAALVVGVLASTTAQAQTAQNTGETRWRAWVGCWEPVSPDNVISTADAKAMRVCIVPSGGRSAVDIVNVANGKVAERTHLDATGERHPIGREGCTGVESADWSADNLRVYLKAELTCDGVQRTTSGILAFAPSGEWLDVQGVTTGKNSGVHVTRYRPVSDLAGIPADITSALPNAQLAQSTARGAAAGPVDPQDVAEAVRHVQAPVVEAWLLERGQGFALSASQLVALANEGVPGSTTDLMVALSFPKTFAINHGTREPSLTAPSAGQQGTVVAGRTIPVYADPYGYSPFGWGPYSSYYSWYGYNYGAYPYGGYGSPYGGYGYGYGGGPIIIVRNGDTPAGPSTSPRVVRGRGYTEGRSTPSTSSGSRSSSSSGSSGSSSAGTSSSAGSSSGSSSSGGERTAHSRVPR